MHVFITVWVLTVSYINPNSKVGFSYQLQYKDKKTCMANIRAHSAHYTNPDNYFKGEIVNEGKRARCDASQVVVGVK